MNRYVDDRPSRTVVLAWVRATYPYATDADVEAIYQAISAATVGTPWLHSASIVFGRRCSCGECSRRRAYERGR